MHPRLPQGLSLFLLLSLCSGCRAPQTKSPLEPQAQWEVRVQAAAEASPSSYGDARLKEYREGFLNGAQMIRASLEQGRSPYLPVLSTEGPALRFLGAPPPGFSAEGQPLERELDPETGLEIRRIQGDASTPFPKGQVDGFRWALDHQGRTLRHPLPPPQPPSRWEAWPSTEPVLGLSAPGNDLLLNWQPGLLLWQSQRKGFPIQRCWRRLPFQEPLLRAALDNDCLWIETAGGQIAALSLQNGVVREVLPADALPKGPASASATRAEEAREQEAIRRDLHRKAEAGDPKAMLALAHFYRGQGAPAKAKPWYLKAAEAGEPDAMIRMAVPLLDSPRPEDRAQARQWIERAAKAGSAEAQTFLALLARSEAK